MAIAARKELRKELRQERTRQERVNPAGLMGGLTSWLQSGVGGALGGGAAGSVVSNGLNELIKGLEQHGSGDAARSWVGNGPNQQVSPNDLAKAADSDTLDALARESGMSRDELLPRLSAELPQTVDKLTPQGRVPTPEEASQAV